MWWIGYVVTMIISDIEVHRQQKLKSLLCGNLDSELSELKKLINTLGLSEEERGSVDEVLSYAMKQTYGTHTLLKFYVSHPIRVGIFVLNWMIEHKQKDKNFLIAALIHNVIEKNIMTYEEIFKKYGSWVAQVIKVLTVDREAQKAPLWAEGYYSELNKLDTKGQLLKAFDKFDNIYAICLNPDPKVRTEYLDEIEEYISPIIEKHAASNAAYFKELIRRSRQMEHLSIDDFLREDQ